MKTVEKSDRMASLWAKILIWDLLNKKQNANSSIMISGS
jgi:hypothetical protein